MKLFYAPSSPFARKVRIAAAELNLADRLQLEQIDPRTETRLRALNPLAKVPTLVVDSTLVLLESGVICDFLDAQVPGRRLFPADGSRRWNALRLQRLADGAMTAAGRLYADERKPPTQRSDAMMARFRDARDATLDALDQELLGDTPQIGEIAVGALIGYLDFRWPDRDWRANRPRLAAWFAQFQARSSMRTTAHQGA